MLRKIFEQCASASSNGYLRLLMDVIVRGESTFFGSTVRSENAPKSDRNLGTKKRRKRHRRKSETSQICVEFLSSSSKSREKLTYPSQLNEREKKRREEGGKDQSSPRNKKSSSNKE